MAPENEESTPTGPSGADGKDIRSKEAREVKGWRELLLPKKNGGLERGWTYNPYLEPTEKGRIKISKEGEDGQMQNQDLNRATIEFGKMARDVCAQIEKEIKELDEKITLLQKKSGEFSFKQVAPTEEGHADFKVENLSTKPFKDEKVKLEGMLSDIMSKADFEKALDYFQGEIAVLDNKIEKYDDKRANSEIREEIIRTIAEKLNHLNADKSEMGMFLGRIRQILQSQAGELQNLQGRHNAVCRLEGEMLKINELIKKINKIKSELSKAKQPQPQQI